MIKIWVKTIKEYKIIKSFIFSKEEKYSAADIFAYLAEIGEILDFPVPVVLKKHIKHLVLYNQIKFNDNDFIEEVDFDALVLENLSGKAADV